MKKEIKIILIIFIVIILIAIIFCSIDYNRAINEKIPIFFYRTEIVSSTKNNTITEYYGLGYKLVVCDNCDKKAFMMTLYIGTYAWFIGDDIKIIVKERDSNSDNVHLNELTDSYIENDNIIQSKIYTYGIDQINVVIDDQHYSLKDALSQKKIILNDILVKLSTEDILYDDGTVIYRDINEEKIANGNLTIIKCNAIYDDEINQDLYIGTSKMIKENYFCYE